MSPPAAEIKKVVQIPVIVAGRINDPVLANQILKEGEADLIAMGRALIADPYLPLKTLEGKTGEIRKGLPCMHCRKRIYDLRTIRCTLNAQVGREYETRIFSAHTSKEVLVVGGGAGGLEAARVLALRGHRVELYQRENKLSGQVKLALMPPHKGEIQNILDSFVPVMKQLGVAVLLKKAVTRKTIEKEKGDVFILATGALPLIPEIPGLGSQKVFTPAEALKRKRPLSGEKIIVAGGGMVGCEAAESLASHRNQVTVVEKLPEIGSGMEPFTRTLLVERLNKLAVKVLTGWEIASIQGGEAILKKKGEEMAIGDEFRHK